jgi:hypothetical protein
MTKRRLTALGLVLVILLVAGSLAAQDFRSKGTVLGIKGGLVLPGTVYIEDFSDDGDISFSLGGFADYALAEKLYGGISLDFHNMSVWDESKIMYDISFVLKAKIFSENSPMTFRPGFSVGYGGIPSFEADGYDVDASSYFVVKGMVEAVMPTSSNLSWLIEAAIIGAPAGGNSDYDVTFGPGFLLRGGIVF